MLCLKCSKTYLQAPLIQNFPRVIRPGPSLKREEGRRERRGGGCITAVGGMHSSEYMPLTLVIQWIIHTHRQLTTKRIRMQICADRCVATDSPHPLQDLSAVTDETWGTKLKPWRHEQHLRATETRHRRLAYTTQPTETLHAEPVLSMPRLRATGLAATGRSCRQKDNPSSGPREMRSV